MAQQGPSMGKIILYVVLGVIGVAIGINVITWLIGGILQWLLVIGAVVGVGYLAFKAGQRSVGGGSSRRQIHR
jgi:hypothetical protein